MKQPLEFKPLWRIHNKIYRKYARGIYQKRVRIYLEKLVKMLRIKH